LSSDDDEIMAVAASTGCEVPFRRPAELATDKTRTMEVVEHALRELPGYDYLVLLQPTSPLRTSGDIDAAFQLMLSRNAPACVSVSEVDQSPYWMYQLTREDKLASIMEPLPNLNRRQDLPPTYILNGAIYIANTEWLLKSRSFIGLETVAYQMPKSRSLDIDDSRDFQQFVEVIASVGGDPIF
jgi:N-acylneuraminate cytidylyltransferase